MVPSEDRSKNMTDRIEGQFSVPRCGYLLITLKAEVNCPVYISKIAARAKYWIIYNVYST